MRPLCMLVVFAFVQLFTAADAIAQKHTERYIPIGKSPGLSGKHTMIGTVDTVNVQQGTMTCTSSYGTMDVKVEKGTMIWLDRSKLGLTNIEGSLGACRKGHVVEVKFRNNDREVGVAEWIKVAEP